jgi:hypothetical protein
MIPLRQITTSLVTAQSFSAIKPPAPVNGLDAPAWQGVLPWCPHRPFNLNKAPNVAFATGEITHHHGKVAVFTA